MDNLLYIIYMTWILKYMYTVSIYYSRTVDLERVPDKVTFISTTDRFSNFLTCLDSLALVTRRKWFEINLENGFISS
jgi:hypothetical protein